MGASSSESNDNMERLPRCGEIYRHFKNRLYQVVAVAEHARTEERLVVCQALFGDYGVYAVPLEEFGGRVDRRAFPDAAQERRFEPVRRDSLSGGGEKQSLGEDDFATRVHGTQAEVIARRMHDAKMAKAQGTLSQGAGAASAYAQGTFAQGAGASYSATRNTAAQSAARNAGAPGAAVQNASMPQGAAAPRAARNAAAGQRTAPQGASAAVQGAGAASDGEAVNPKLMAFLDSDDLDERYNILVSMRDEVDDHLINSMAVVLDVVIPEGDVFDRYEQLKSCIRTKQRYEAIRPR